MGTENNENNTTTVSSKVVITKTLITAIADAIREATGTTDLMTIDQMITAIQAM